MIQRLMSVLLAVCLLIAIPLTVAAEDVLWIDVRTAQEFSDGHVTQAVNIPYDEIADHINTVAPDKDAPIYVYCRSGRRSGIAKDTLDGLGYTQVVNIGGLDDALEKAGQSAGDQ